MALVYKDRVKQYTAAPSGAAAFDFSAASTPTGYQTFTSVLSNAETCIYGAEDQSGNWEIGLGTWTAAGTTLARTTILASSNAGSAETFSGTVTVYITNDAKRTQNIYDIGNLGFLARGLTATRTITGSTFSPFTDGGTTNSWNTPDYDPDSTFTASTGVWVPNKTGRWLVSAVGVVYGLADGKRTIISLQTSTDSGSTWTTRIVDFVRGYSAAGSAYVGGGGAQIIEVTNTSHQYRLSCFHDDTPDRNIAPEASLAAFGANYIGEVL